MSIALDQLSMFPKAAASPIQMEIYQRNASEVDLVVANQITISVVLKGLLAMTVIAISQTSSSTFPRVACSAPMSSLVTILLCSLRQNPSSSESGISTITFCQASELTPRHPPSRMKLIACQECEIRTKQFWAWRLRFATVSSNAWQAIVVELEFTCLHPIWELTWG